jgi:sporulation protein YlmC with PRC-barrel domain
VELMKDVSDKQVVDRDGREIGRVDRILLDLREGAPRVVALEIGPEVLASRVSTLFGRFVAGLEVVLGLDEDRPVRIAISEVTAMNPWMIHVDRMFAQMPAGVVEAALKRWLPRLPGAR